MTTNRSIDDVRRHLFSALDGLADKDKPMDLDRAKMIADVAQVIINSAKVEVDYLKVAGGESPFMGGQPEQGQLPPGITGIVQHRLRG